MKSVLHKVYPMVIEWLNFQVDSQRREEFIQKDAEIWTPVLAKIPGFLSKEIWISPDSPTELICIIHWASHEQWKSVPQKLVDETEQRFAEAMDNTYQLVECKEYQVRKFPHF